jgi:hypothetical protein
LRGAFPLFEKDRTTNRQETMMLEENLARLRAHRHNTHRYRRLLETKLSEVERTYILRRLGEEKAAAEAILRSGFPVALPTANSVILAA